MLEIRCDDCGAVIPGECVEHDEAARTLFHLTEQRDGYRVLAISVSDYDAPPAHPYADGQERDLCVACLIMTLQSPPLGDTNTHAAEPMPAGTPRD